MEKTTEEHVEREAFRDRGQNEYEKYLLEENSEIRLPHDITRTEKNSENNYEIKPQFVTQDYVFLRPRNNQKKSAQHPFCPAFLPTISKMVGVLPEKK